LCKFIIELGIWSESGQIPIGIWLDWLDLLGFWSDWSDSGRIGWILSECVGEGKVLYRDPLENMTICEKKVPLWCCCMESVYLIFGLSAPAVKRYCEVSLSLEKVIKLDVPCCNLLRKVLWEESSTVRDQKNRVKCLNKVYEKITIHKNPQKSTTDEHPEHCKLNLDYLLC